MVEAEKILKDLLSSIEFSENEELKKFLLFKVLRDLGVVYEVTNNPMMIQVYMKSLEHSPPLPDKFTILKSIAVMLANNRKL